MNRSTFSSLSLEDKKIVLQNMIWDIETNINNIITLGKKAIKNSNTNNKQLIWIYDQIVQQLQGYNSKLTQEKHNKYLNNIKNIKEKEKLELEDPDEILNKKL